MTKHEAIEAGSLHSAMAPLLEQARVVLARQETAIWREFSERRNRLLVEMVERRRIVRQDWLKLAADEFVEKWGE